MNYSHLAKALGRRGGLKRAKNLSAKRKKQIASSGGLSRAESIKQAKRIETNFKYLQAIQELMPQVTVRSEKNTNEKLPGIYG